jgi:hypothetical protein
MPSIFVPPRTAAALAIENLVRAVLQHVAFEPDPSGAKDDAGEPLQRDRAVRLTVAELKEAFGRLHIPVPVRDRVMARLLRDRLVRTDGTSVWVGDLADLRAFLAKRGSPAIIGAGA